VYQPYEILKCLYYLINPFGKAIHVCVDQEVLHEDRYMYINLGGRMSEKCPTKGYNISLYDQQDVISDNTFLISHFGYDVCKHEEFFEMRNEFLSLILWSLGPHFPCQWSNI